METGKGIKVRDAAMPQFHCSAVTDELPQDQGEARLVHEGRNEEGAG